MWHSHMLRHHADRLYSDHALGTWHFQCGVDSVDNRHKLQEERPPDDVVLPDVKTGYLECQHFLALIVPCST
jgi:hypothetical protein